MKTLHLYLTRQVIVSLLMTVAVFTFVLLVGNLLKEILTLLMSRQVTPGTALEAIALLIPFAWVFAFPLGMLTATLLVFGRFSADNELTAVRASGVSLLSLITPILWLSLLLCVVSALVNLEFGPRCRKAYKQLVYDLKVELAKSALPEGRFIKDFPGYILFVEKIRGQNLENIKVLVLQHETNVIASVRAPRGRYEINSTNREVVLQLFDASSISIDGDRVQIGKADLTQSFPFDPGAKGAPRVKLGELSFLQLREELRDLERRMNLPLSPRVAEGDASGGREQALRKQLTDLTSPIRVQMHRQVALSLACFGFTLVGIPLGIRMHRRETNVGLGVGLALAALYYSLILLGQSLETRPEFVPQFIVWLPNFIFQSVGVVLLVRANRGM